MTKLRYSIDAPDQQRLKVARLEIEAVLQKHDLAGAVVLHTPGMTEWFYQLRPSYSCMWIDEVAGIARIKAKLEDYGGDQAAQLHDITCTANMVAGMRADLGRGYAMFTYIQPIVDRATGATHTPRGFVPDPNEGRRQ